MQATAGNADKVSERVPAQLVAQFDVDTSFLRHNDHNNRASKLDAQWPPRYDDQIRGPLAIVYG